MFLFHHSPLSLPQSNSKSFPVLPVKTGLRSLSHFLATCHATRLTLTLFRSTPENHAAIYMHKSPGMVSGGIPPMWIFCLWMVGCRSSEGWWKAECATKTTVFRWSGLCLVMAWTSWWIWSTYTCQSMWKRMWSEVCRERETKNYIKHGRFPFNKNSGLKFRKFHMPNGTVQSGCTDSTQATARLVIILLSDPSKQVTKERYWGQQFCQMERDISVRPSEMISDRSKWTIFKAGPEYSGRTKPK